MSWRKSDFLEAGAKSSWKHWRSTKVDRRVWTLQSRSNLVCCTVCLLCLNVQDIRMMRQWHPLGPVLWSRRLSFPLAVWRGNTNAWFGLVATRVKMWKRLKKRLKCVRWRKMLPNCNKMWIMLICHEIPESQRCRKWLVIVSLVKPLQRAKQFPHWFLQRGSTVWVVACCGKKQWLGRLLSF